MRVCVSTSTSMIEVRKRIFFRCLSRSVYVPRSMWVSRLTSIENSPLGHLYRNIVFPATANFFFVYEKISILANTILIYEKTKLTFNVFTFRHWLFHVQIVIPSSLLNEQEIKLLFYWNVRKKFHVLQKPSVPFNKSINSHMLFILLIDI